MNSISFNLNITPGNAIPQRVQLSQYDNIMPTMVVSLYDGHEKFMIPSGSVVFVAGTKKDGKGFEYECTYSGNTVTVVITEQMTAFAGDVVCEIIVANGEERKGTANFILAVEKAALDENTPVSETDIPIIEKIPQYVDEIRDECAYTREVIAQDAADAVATIQHKVDTAEAYIDNAVYEADIHLGQVVNAAQDQFDELIDDFTDDMTAEVQTAEAWARGTRNSVPVSQGDQTYNNNAKHYAEQADFVGQVHAEDAEAWAVGQRDGTDVRPTDATYHNNARYYAAEAATDALQADSARAGAQTILDNVQTAVATAVASDLPIMVVNTVDGHLYWTGGRFTFNVNNKTGHLMWEVA